MAVVNLDGMERTGMVLIVLFVVQRNESSRLSLLGSSDAAAAAKSRMALVIVIVVTVAVAVAVGRGRI